MKKKKMSTETKVALGVAAGLGGLFFVTLRSGATPRLKEIETALGNTNGFMVAELHSRFIKPDGSFTFVINASERVPLSDILDLAAKGKLTSLRVNSIEVITPENSKVENGFFIVQKGAPLVNAQKITRDALKSFPVTLDFSREFLAVSSELINNRKSLNEFSQFVFVNVVNGTRVLRITFNNENITIPVELVYRTTSDDRTESLRNVFVNNSSELIQILNQNNNKIAQVEIESNVSANASTKQLQKDIIESGFRANIFASGSE